MKIHLGCNDDLKPGWVNVDQIPAPSLPIDREWEYLQADLAERWPFDGSSADYILANDVFEHLLSPGIVPPKVWCMNEAWRVLKPGGILEFTVPCIHLQDRNRINPAAFSDPSHVSYWTYEDAFYFAGQFNHAHGERGRLGPGMGITARFKFPEMFEDTTGLWSRDSLRSGEGHLVWAVTDYGPKMSRRSKIHARLEAME